MSSEDTQKNTTAPSTDATIFPLPTQRSSTDTNSGSTKPTSVSESTTEKSGQDQKVGKTDTDATESGQLGIKDGSTQVDLPIPISQTLKIPQELDSADHVHQNDAMVMRTIPLADYLNVDHQDWEYGEQLQELAGMLPATSPEDMLWAVKQMEMQMAPPPFGVTRIKHILGYARLQNRIKNAFRDMSAYETRDSI